jgi:hypothetical protein
MMNDATGKFSSRCVLPDRKSLAVVMGENSYQVEGATAHKCPPLRSRKGIVRSHIGEYAAKTNAIGNFEPLTFQPERQRR